ncbi:hypothetical protein [Paracoccus xiamenensis]|uniref:hypothetical protein n=1 Tax=Paracoccus xiamenensis TaxID=2714901 RepID=UPI00140CCC66|nr:hypothetical protein [Paracoccus xiamenensis]NHF72628.1 hypothetical protein [Paracoccus xiamenensis]
MPSLSVDIPVLETGCSATAAPRALRASATTPADRLDGRSGASVQADDLQIRGTPCLIYRHPKGAA